MMDDAYFEDPDLLQLCFSDWHDPTVVFYTCLTASSHFDVLSGRVTLETGGTSGVRSLSKEPPMKPFRRF